jgi:hypothetical protein
MESGRVAFAGTRVLVVAKPVAFLEGMDWLAALGRQILRGSVLWHGANCPAALYDACYRLRGIHDSPCTRPPGAAIAE